MKFDKWFESIKSNKNVYNVGLVGYSSGSFDENKARTIIKSIFDMLVSINPNRKYVLVSRIDQHGSS